MCRWYPRWLPPMKWWGENVSQSFAAVIHKLLVENENFQLCWVVRLLEWFWKTDFYVSMARSSGNFLFLSLVIKKVIRNRLESLRKRSAEMVYKSCLWFFRNMPFVSRNHWFPLCVLCLEPRSHHLVQYPKNVSLSVRRQSPLCYSLQMDRKHSINYSH